MRRFAALFLLPLVVAVSLSGCTLPGFVSLPSDVVYPSIEPLSDAGPMAPMTLAWQFEGAEVRLSVPVDAAVYRGAKNAQKSALFFREIEEMEWIPEYYRAFVGEPHQEPLYESMLQGLRALRDSLGLGEDRYAELIVTLVQSLEYRTDPVYLEPKFPVETVGDANGDCDDKTLLAAALLAREGYDVAILLFSAEQHVSLGIRSDGSTYSRSGYAIVETTTPILFGWVPDSLNGDISLASEPMVIRIGEGTRSYGAGRQTDAIRDRFDEAVVEAEELGERASESQRDLERRAREVEEVRAQMDALAAAGDAAGYNKLVPRYNRLVEEYNAAVEEHNALVAQQNEAVATAARITEGQTDRYGLARFLGLGS
ncbi:MAG: hypothetical protein IBX63_03645 [Coriobacteriia bacterium]|nr:hypothetical protein [Coriobacteriia bacterium]